MGVLRLKRVSAVQLISVNVGLPREVNWKGKAVTTAIFKTPVAGPQMLETLNFAGDRQADLSVHGGVHKAVYAYPVHHYADWQNELPDIAFSWGMFGENLTIDSLAESDVRIGDLFQVGSAIIRATEPRLPCYKLGIRFGRPDMVKRFLASRRTGVYFAVVQPGIVEAGNVMTLINQSPHQVSIADITRVFAFDKDDQATMKRIVAIEDLSEGWRDYFLQRLHA